MQGPFIVHAAGYGKNLSFVNSLHETENSKNLKQKKKSKKEPQ